ncbi:MAG TPA: class I SAM-dependent methyltransferase [Vicinamibacterales bacterium]
MRDDRFSRTAFGVAVRRATHQVLDGGRVFADPLAIRIIGDDGRQRLQAQVDAPVDASRTLRLFVAARSRYAEDQLAAAVESGVHQYVILGAGLDTFAYRNPHPALRVFEVDHPATQGLKLERLRTEGIAVPASAAFVPVDFEKTTLRAGLQSVGFGMNEPAFFSWLGVTPYLTRDACFDTLRFIADRSAGSGVVFDFAVSREMLGPMEKMVLDALSARVARAGEPFRLFFNPDALEADLGKLGFRRIEILDSREIDRRYFNGREKRLRAGSLGRLLAAWI